MERNVRGFLIAEMSKRARQSAAVRSDAKDRDKGLLEWGAQSGARRNASPPIAQEHSRISPMTPLPRAESVDRILRGATITGGEDEDKRRTLPWVSGKGQKAAPGEQSKGRKPALGRGASLTSRAGALAQGYQPAVVKVVSYAHGAPRAAATANYVDREDAVLETHQGIELKGREAINAEIGAWSKDFEQRTESQDVSAVRLHVTGLKDRDDDRAMLKQSVEAAFKSHSYAYRIETLQNGAIQARAVVAFAGTPEPPTTNGQKPKTERFSVTERQIGAGDEGFRERVFAPKSEARMKARIEDATGLGQHRLSIEPGAPGHGQSSVIHRLTQLTERAPATSSTGSELKDASAIQAEARALRRDLRSFSPRDTMHMIVSAKAGTDVEAFAKSVRGFLHEQFADHKFMFGVHTDKAEAGHIHAHAIVTVRNAEGQKMHPGQADFRGWRETFAEHAQENFLKIVATSAADRASSQSYGPRDKAIVDAAERPRAGREARDRAYSSDPANQPLIDNARRRIERARENPIRFPTTVRQLISGDTALSAWSSVAKQQPQNEIATANVSRLLTAQFAGETLVTLSKLAILPEQNRRPDMTLSSDKMNADLKVLNEAVDNVTAVLPEGSRRQFMDRAGAYLEKIAERVDLQRALEVRTPQAQAALQPVVTEAQRIASAETREAAASQRVADRAVALERRAESTPNAPAGSPSEIDTKRSLVRQAEQFAATDAQKAAAAQEAQRALTANAAAPIAATLAADARLEELRVKQAATLRTLTQDRANASEAEIEAEQ
jgi:type IV secretion system T-DNA border endonuclease VirD2